MNKLWAALCCALVFMFSVPLSSFAQTGAAPTPGQSARTFSLAAAATELKAEAVYDPLTGYGYFTRFGVNAVFTAGVPWILWDWTEAESVPAPQSTASGLTFDPGFIVAARERYSAIEKEHKSRFAVAAILIDPGHGGKDTGAIGEHVHGDKTLKVVEKEVNLEIATRVYTDLKQRFPERRILISREKDTYPTLEERVAMANSETLEENQAIIYVSIHANASFNKNAKGFEVWYLNPEYRRTVINDSASKKISEDIVPIMNAMLEEEFTTESIMLARQILGRMDRVMGKESSNRGIRAEEWFVVRNARMPSVLIETGFVTNPDEAVLLDDEDYLRLVGDAIYNGIVDFVQYFEGLKGVSR